MAGVCGGECMKHCLGYEPLTLTRCHSCLLSQLYEALEEQNSTCGRAYNLKDIEVKIYIFLLFTKLRFSFTVAHFMI